MEWLVNYHPPWEAYCALMKGHMIWMDNHPEIRPVGIVLKSVRLSIPLWNG